MADCAAAVPALHRYVFDPAQPPTDSAQVLGEGVRRGYELLIVNWGGVSFGATRITQTLQQIPFPFLLPLHKPVCGLGPFWVYSGGIPDGHPTVYSPNDHPTVYVVQTSPKRRLQTFDPT